MNRMREIIYEQRHKVLDGEDLHDSILKMFDEVIKTTVDQYLVGDDEEDKENWNLAGLADHFMPYQLTTGDDFKYDEKELEKITRNDIIKKLDDKAKEIYSEKEKSYGKELMREVERVLLLKVVDTKWMAHIDDMEELKKGINLRAYGQKNPVVEYRVEGFEMFDAMVYSIRDETVRLLLNVRLQPGQNVQREQVAKPDAPNAGSFSNAPRTVKKVGENDPCPCGSGKKYKKCCGMKE